MATEAFSFTGIGSNETDAITMAADKELRVRFTTATGSAAAQLKIVANSTTTYYDVFQYDSDADDKQASLFELLEGDVVSLVVVINRDNTTIAGILEEV